MQRLSGLNKIVFLAVFIFAVMAYAMIIVPAAPIRKKPAHSSEMVNQLLFGEAVKIIRDREGLWVKIESLHDGYQGWISRSMTALCSKEEARAKPGFCTADLFSPMNFDNKTMHIPAGSNLPQLAEGKGRVGDFLFQYNGKLINLSSPNGNEVLLNELVMPWMNVPYLWGGRSILGIDCSGFVQLIFKLMGYQLPRDAWQQAKEGRSVKKLKLAEAGDLVFFKREKRIVHVGILLSQDEIIHASGKVRIDRIDKKGVYDAASGKKILRPAMIRRIIN